MPSGQPTAVATAPQLQYQQLLMMGLLNQQPGGPGQHGAAGAANMTPAQLHQAMNAVFMNAPGAPANPQAALQKAQAAQGQAGQQSGQAGQQNSQATGHQKKAPAKPPAGGDPSSSSSSDSDE